MTDISNGTVLSILLYAIWANAGNKPQPSWLQFLGLSLIALILSWTGRL